MEISSESVVSVNMVPQNIQEATSHRTSSPFHSTSRVLHRFGRMFDSLLFSAD